MDHFHLTVLPPRINLDKNMFLNDTIKSEIKQHALNENPNECCGFIIEDKNSKNITINKCKNISKNPLISFKISSQEYLSTKEIGEILSIYHSHPGDSFQFSELDKKISEAFNLKNIVYLIKKDDFIEYIPQGYENPYVGRQYYTGIFDCYTLVQDYFKRELNININDLPILEYPMRLIDEKYVLKKFSTIENIIDYSKKHAENNDFIEISNQNLKKHDLLILKNSGHGLPIHILIYLGNNNILHQTRETSLIEEYNTDFKKRVIHALRHKSLL